MNVEQKQSKAKMCNGQLGLRVDSRTSGCRPSNQATWLGLWVCL